MELTPHLESQAKKKSLHDLPPVFVAPRRLLDEDVAALHSPGAWEDAFPRKGQSLDQTMRLNNMQLVPTSDDDDNDNEPIHFKSLPRRRKPKQYTFKIGTSQHNTFASAIADLMSRPSDEADIIRNRVSVRTPVEPDFMLDPNGQDSGDRQLEERSSSESLVRGIMIPGSPRSRNYGRGFGKLPMAQSLPDGLGMGVDLDPSPFPVPTTSSASSSEESGSFKRGRFEIRRL
ncbi:hypothetical protein HDU79_003138 [Rhizoclosmatium sp. JEL0117]|nr:hypothetical protein HDU79_003138 [Rhizoclosmatium sp. JEL0117]